MKYYCDKGDEVTEALCFEQSTTARESSSSCNTCD